MHVMWARRSVAVTAVAMLAACGGGGGGGFAGALHRGAGRRQRQRRRHLERHRDLRLDSQPSGALVYGRPHPSPSAARASRSSAGPRRSSPPRPRMPTAVFGQCLRAPRSSSRIKAQMIQVGRAPHGMSGCATTPSPRPSTRSRPRRSPPAPVPSCATSMRRPAGTAAATAPPGWRRRSRSSTRSTPRRPRCSRSRPTAVVPGAAALLERQQRAGERQPRARSDRHDLVHHEQPRAGHLCPGQGRRRHRRIRRLSHRARMGSLLPIGLQPRRLPRRQPRPDRPARPRGLLRGLGQCLVGHGAGSQQLHRFRRPGPGPGSQYRSDGAASSNPDGFARPRSIRSCGGSTARPASSR